MGGLLRCYPSSLTDIPWLHAAATAPTAAATVSTNTQSRKAVSADPVAAARLAYKVASNAMPNDPDSRSAILNNVLASGIRLGPTPARKAITSGWMVSPRASPRPQSSPVVTQTGVVGVSSSSPMVLAASRARPPDTLTVIMAGRALPRSTSTLPSQLARPMTTPCGNSTSPVTAVTGLVLLPQGVVMGLASWLGSVLVERGKARPAMITVSVSGGLALLAASTMGLLLLTPTTPVWVTTGLLCGRGLALGLTIQPLVMAFLAGVGPSRMPDANTLFNMAERLSGSFGIALLATLYASRAATTGSPVTALHDCALVLVAAAAVGAVAAACNHGMSVNDDG